MPKKAKATDTNIATSDQPTALDFEKSISDLEQLVEKMEAGDFNLEQSLKQFEQGISLTRKCQQSLQAAELKVKQLVDAETLATAEFNLDDKQQNDDL